MSQKYKDKYEELRNNDLGTKQSNDNSNPKEEEIYATPGNVRNIGFVWEDGRRVFLNYAYLVSVELLTINEMNVLTISFTTKIIKVYGHKLDILYKEIFDQSVRSISVVKNRYLDPSGNQFIATEIEILSG